MLPTFPSGDIEGDLLARGDSAGEKLGEIGQDAKLMSLGIGDLGRIGNGGKGPVRGTFAPLLLTTLPAKFRRLLLLSEELLEILFDIMPQ